MNLRLALGAIALAAGASASLPAAAAGCTSTFNLASMGPPAATTIGNAFFDAQHFDDCYNFTLNNSAEAFGLTLEWDWSLSSGIDVNSVSLSGTGLAAPVVDGSPGLFSFSNLLAGAYQLIVSGDVSSTNQFGAYGGPVGYVGVLATSASTVATPVPEPQAYAMLMLGLGVVVWASRRRPPKHTAG
jgi:hypothetical protein